MGPVPITCPLRLRLLLPLRSPQGSRRRRVRPAHRGMDAVRPGGCSSGRFSSACSVPVSANKETSWGPLPGPAPSGMANGGPHAPCRTTHTCTHSWLAHRADPRSEPRCSSQPRLAAGSEQPGLTNEVEPPRPPWPSLTRNITPICSLLSSGSVPTPSPSSESRAL